MYKYLKLAACCASLIFMASCATTTGVITKGGDVYTINVSRGGLTKVKLRAYQHAEKHCARTGQSVLVVNENLRTDPQNISDGIIDLDFKCTGQAKSKSTPDK